jgi:hypothetical protein
VCFEVSVAISVCYHGGRSDLSLTLPKAAAGADVIVFSIPGRATRLRPTRTPCAASSKCTRGTP